MNKKATTTMGVVLLATVLCGVACKHDPEFTQERTRKVDMTKSRQTIEIPAEVYSKIKVAMKSDLAASEPAEGAGEKSGEKSPEESSVEQPPESAPKLNLFPFDVFLIEKSHGVIKNGSARLNYAPGGGELDLADFVSEHSEGTFFLGILPTLNGENGGEVDDWQTFLVSDSKKRELDGSTVGYGCATYLELTNFFKKVMKGEGIEAFTFKRRYVSLLAGTYFMIVKSSGKVFAAQLTVFDSRYKSLMCRSHYG